MHEPWPDIVEFGDPASQSVDTYNDKFVQTFNEDFANFLWGSAGFNFSVTVSQSNTNWPPALLHQDYIGGAPQQAATFSPQPAPFPQQTSFTQSAPFSQQTFFAQPV